MTAPFPAFRIILYSLIFIALCVPSQAQQALPTAEQALSAYRDFMQDPPRRLAQTQPFLSFIRDSGAVHMLLNDGLLAWMHDPNVTDEDKAVLYAAYLGANMESQLANETTGSDNVAAMKGVLKAYESLRKDKPEFHIALLDSLSAYENESDLRAAVSAIVLGKGN